jgi:hypothetical protein
VTNEDSKSKIPSEYFSEEEIKLIAEWSALPAPGEDQTSRLAVPGIVAPAHTRTINRQWQSTLLYAPAAAVIFCAGYVLGVSRHADGSGPAQETAMPRQQVTTGPIDLQPPAAERKRTSEQSSKSEIAAVRQDSCPEPTIASGPDGRIQIQTTLCATGSPATWIVDARLQLAQVSSDHLNPEGMN